MRLESATGRRSYAAKSIWFGAVSSLRSRRLAVALRKERRAQLPSSNTS
jgi:hypothetical protein